MQTSKDWLDTLTRERSTSKKDWGVTLVLSVFLGMFGGDRFYTGRAGLGVLKLLTFGGYGFWWVTDIILVSQGRMKDGLDRRIVKHRG